MLRAQTLVTLKEYTSALFDVNRLMELNPSSEVYQNLEARLRTQLVYLPPSLLFIFRRLSPPQYNLGYKTSWIFYQLEGKHEAQ
jgi:hypothetical protein